MEKSFLDMLKLKKNLEEIYAKIKKSVVKIKLRLKTARKNVKKH